MTTHTTEADAVQAQAIAVVEHLTAMLRAKGWDFVAVSIARGMLLDDGTATLPGATTFEAAPHIMPAIPALADNLRVLARELDAHYTGSGCPTRADGYSHVIDSVAVREKRGGAG